MEISLKILLWRGKIVNQSMKYRISFDWTMQRHVCIQQLQKFLTKSIRN